MGNSFTFPKYPDRVGVAASCPPVGKSEFEAAIAKLSSEEAKVARGVALLVYMRAVAYVYRDIVKQLAVPAMDALTKRVVVESQRAFVQGANATLKFAPEGRHLEGAGIVHVPNSGSTEIEIVGVASPTLLGGQLQVVPVHLESSIEAKAAVAMMDKHMQKTTGPVLFVGDFNVDAKKVKTELGGRARVVMADKPSTVKIRGVADNMQLGKAFEMAKKNIDYAVLYNGDGYDASIERVEGQLMTEEIASDHYPILVTVTKDGESESVLSWNAFGNTLQGLDDGEPAFREFLPLVGWKETAAFQFYKTASGDVAEALKRVRLGDAGTLYDYALEELRRVNPKRGDDNVGGGLEEKAPNPTSTKLAAMFGVEPASKNKLFTSGELLSRPEVVFPTVKTSIGPDEIAALLAEPYKLIMHVPIFEKGQDDAAAPLRYTLEAGDDNRKKWHMQVTGNAGPFSLERYFYVLSSLWKSKASQCE